MIFPKKSSKNSTITLRLQLIFSKGLITMVPFQLGYDWGKLLIKANKNDCLSFVPCLGVTADIPGMVRIVPTFTLQEHPVWSWMLHRPAGTVTGHFTTRLIQLRFVRSCWDCRAAPKRSWGRGMYYHNKLSSVFSACINTQKYRLLQKKSYWPSESSE